MYTYMYMCTTIVGGNPHILMSLWYVSSFTEIVKS